MRDHITSQFLFDLMIIFLVRRILKKQSIPESPTSIIIALTGVWNRLLIPPIQVGNTPESAVH